jgi:hypothetical protein
LLPKLENGADALPNMVLQGLKRNSGPVVGVLWASVFRDKLLTNLDTQPMVGLPRWDCQTLVEDLGASKYTDW